MSIEHETGWIALANVEKVKLKDEKQERTNKD